MKIRTLSGWVCTAVVLMGSVPAWSDVYMGVFPRRPVAVTHNAFRPLAERLSKALGEKVILVIPKNFKAFWAGVKAKRFDIVHYNQYHYLKSHKAFGYKVIATNEERGSKTIRGQLSVRKDSGIKSVADLKGKTILFGGGPKAMGSYIAPTAVLKKAGLTAGKDYQVRFAKNPPSALIGAFHKASDAAGSGDVIFHVKSVKTKIDVAQMLPLAVSEPFIHLTWAVKDSFSDDKMKKVVDVMISLKKTPSGKAILKAAKVTGFHKATDADFAKVREITKFALGEDL